MGSPPLLELRGLTKRFGDFTAVDRLALEVASGEFLTLLGASGSGKTTTLRMIAGFELPSAGDILMAGAPITQLPPYKRDINTVFQHYALFPHMNVAQNVGYGLRQKKVGKDEERRRASEALELVRLGGYERRRTWELSGGQQQRVAVARALVTRPEVVFADEPTGNLDSRTGAEILAFMREAVREFGQTIVMVTHDPVAASYADRAVFLSDGRIVDEIDHPTADSVFDRLRTLGAK